MSKRELNPQRKKVVILCAAVAAMSGGPVLLRGHPVLLGIWLAIMIIALGTAVVELARLKRLGL